jgi:putative DNA primase/helicase
MLGWELGAGLDVRADGGYVAAPPSSHETGRPYQLLHDRELAALPTAFLELIVENGSMPKATAITEIIPKGRRRSELLSLAGTLRRRGLGEQEIYAALARGEYRTVPPTARQP